nr:MAG TPA: hypothetical protein [Caudoviricetes sp.]
MRIRVCAMQALYTLPLREQGFCLFRYYNFIKFIFG